VSKTPSKQACKEAPLIIANKENNKTVRVRKVFFQPQQQHQQQQQQQAL